MSLRQLIFKMLFIRLGSWFTSLASVSLD